MELNLALTRGSDDNDDIDGGGSRGGGGGCGGGGSGGSGDVGGVGGRLALHLNQRHIGLFAVDGGESVVVVGSRMRL